MHFMFHLFLINAILLCINNCVFDPINQYCTGHFVSRYSGSKSYTVSVQVAQCFGH